MPQETDPSEPDIERPATSWDWLHRIADDRKLVLSTLFLVTAALGLPLLWMSRSFSVVAKLLWSIVVLVYTALILWLFYVVMVWCYQRIVDSLPA